MIRFYHKGKEDYHAEMDCLDAPARDPDPVFDSFEMRGDLKVSSQ